MPTPEKTIFFGLIPAFKAFIISPIDTTSAPQPIFFISLSKLTFEFDFTAKQIKGFIGIGSAPDFLERVMWKKFSRKMKRETIKNGVYHLKHGEYEYPITFQLIKDGRKNKVLHKRIDLKIPVTLFHGKKDDTVPVVYSRKLLKIFKFARKKLVRKVI